MVKENSPSPIDRGPLFPGSSCFPLSPDQRSGGGADFKFHTRGNKDQLNVIFNVIGTPTREDVSGIEKEDAKRYLECFAPRKGSGLKGRFPAASGNVVVFVVVVDFVNLFFR